MIPKHTTLSIFVVLRVGTPIFFLIKNTTQATNSRPTLKTNCKLRLCQVFGLKIEHTNSRKSTKITHCKRGLRRKLHTKKKGVLDNFLVKRT